MPVAIDVERTEIFERAQVSPATPSLASAYGASFASAYAARYDGASYDALPVLSCEDDDDDVPRLPPPPARGSQTYAVPNLHDATHEATREVVPVAPVEIRPRARATIVPPVPPRRPQSHTPVDNEAIYQAVLRHFR